ncbi:hypothetical protein NMK71_00845 [Weeksellaceae bacterium KMM 9713]|uniref:Lipocalin-like domain-containing protein n=1 Tax=Profundicola chukchiensis TaxID=2961959 RepID=A0A9X4MWM9_9FLAO|nr:hypothetical protein [Profundicola chukchiensis]MDG4944950.1 hypothetical protein [Profundicola chukchiensis]MDG4950038.1 hypothetical protein [Profundicola chukchiensis]
MRKLLLLFGALTFLSMSFISCSSDDDGPSDTVNNSIYGTWKTDYKVVNDMFVEGSDLCDEKLEYRFSNNGSYTLKTFTGDNEDDCLMDTETHGSWEYLGSDKYLIHSNNVTITDNNRDMYTFYLDFRNSNEVRWYTLADHNADNRTFIVLKK